MNANQNNIVHLFLEAAQNHPANVAIVEGDVTITYEELEKEVRLTAAYFKQQGISSGDRVLVFVPMSIDLFRIVLALFYIGAVAVFLDEWVSKERLLLCCRIAECKGFIGTRKARVLGFFAKEIRKIPVKLSLHKRGDKLSSPSAVDLETAALITFTTGSTGLPKAADRSHGFLVAQFSILKEKIKPVPQDIDMPVLPIVLFLNLGIGCTSIIAKFNSRKPTSLQPDQIINQINEHKVNRITASPYFVKTLAEHVIEDKLSIKSVKQIFTGGAPVFPQEAEIYNDAFPETDIQIVYGSTEAEPISTISSRSIMNDKNLRNNGLPVGMIHPKTKLKIINIITQDIVAVDNILDIEVLENQIGEIIVAGDHVLKRYFNNPSAFAANKIVADDEIWHRTGDSGFVKDGQLFLTGRCKQLIYEDDQVISPFIVESKLKSISGVKAGTILRHENLTVLAVETNLPKTQLEFYLKDIHYNRLEILKNVPRDPRHHSKIDYAQLRKSLNTI